jgi:hypothetical protein
VLYVSAQIYVRYMRRSTLIDMGHVYTYCKRV